MSINMEKKTKSKIVPASSTPFNVVKIMEQIGKLEPFGNEEIHRLVAKVNEIIDKLNGSN